MPKKLFSLIIICFIIAALFVPSMVFADDTTKEMVEEIIEGNQDYLVLANIIEKGTMAYEVEIFEVINQPLGDDTDTKDKSPQILDKHINVEGFKNYVYYDDFDYRPQKGDNVLLSLDFNGNSYRIKNGAYRVDSTSHEQFSFMVPESFKGTVEALELNALYIFVNSNGEIKNLTIKENAVYGKDENGEDKKLEILGGLKFIDEFGDTSEKPAPVDIYNNTNGNNSESKWRLAAFIIIIGAVIGVFVVKLNQKLERRYD